MTKFEMQQKLMLNAFMLCARSRRVYLFIVKVFNTLRNLLECLGNFLEFLGYFSHFLELYLFFGYFGHIFMRFNI